MRVQHMRPPAVACSLALLAVLALRGGTATAVAPLEPPQTSFQALELRAPEPQTGVERRWWGLSVRTSGDDVPFPEREPAVLVAARDVDPATQLVRSVAIVVHNAGASGWLGGPGASAKVEALREDALAEVEALLGDPAAERRGDAEESAVAFAALGAGDAPHAKRRVVAVLALGSAWPALDRALAFSMTESLVKAGAADVMDLDSAEQFLLDLGIDPLAEKGPDPPLASWALALGVDAVAAVRATAVRAATTADDGADVLNAEVLWSRADGGIDRNTTTLRVPHRTYPARGKLRFVLAQADDLSAEMIPKLPPAGRSEVLFASRDVTSVDAANTGRRTSAEDPHTGARTLSLRDRALSSAGAGGGAAESEDLGIGGPGFRADSGAARDVAAADPFRRSFAESASDPSVRGERGSGGVREVGGTTSTSGASMETLALGGRGPDGSVGGSRGVNGAGARSVGSIEALSLGGSGARFGADGRSVTGASGNAGTEMESLALVGPGPKHDESTNAGAPEVDWCSLQPKARAIDASGWLVHHPLNRTRIIADGDPMLVEIAKRLAADRGARVRVVGHTCSVGVTQYNFTLGSMRADETRERLIELGVPSARIDATSRGEEDPLCTNENRIGRMNNRRTEIRVDPGSDRTEER